MAGSVSEAVADVQEAVAEQISEVREAALENAAERIQAAEQAAQEITDAAMMTALGQRVDTLQNEVAECRSQNSSLLTEVQELAAQVAALSTPAAPAVIVDNSQTRQQPLPQNAEPAPPEGLDPAEQTPPGEGAGGPEKTAPAKPRRRLL